MDLSDHSEAPKNLSKDNHSSIFALTLDEIQTRSGLNLESMNIDELLNTVANEDFQISSNVDQNPPPFSVPSPLSGKTIDEVFAAIQGNSQPLQKNGGFDFSSDLARNEDVQLEKLGEMTLEDFLIAAGVIARSLSPNPLPMQEHGINLNDLPPPTRRSFFNNGGSGVSVGTAMGYDVGPNNGNGITNSLMSDGSSPFNNMFNLGGSGGGGCNVGEPTSVVENEKSNNLSIREKRTYRKRKAIPIPMVVMDPAEERRQRRMIKNRESAAKSRARKLEHTIQLEKDLDQHISENKRLKFALALAEKKLKQEGSEKEVETKGGFGPLRRTKSASW